MSEETIEQEVIDRIREMQMSSSRTSEDVETDATHSTMDKMKNFESCDRIKATHKPVNSPEKIIFIIDAMSEPNTTPFELGRGEKFSPLFMIKRAIEIFINTKSLLNQEHEFSLIVINRNQIRWLKGFTRNVQDFCNHLDEIREDNQLNSCILDLGELFRVIEREVIKEERNTVTRAILIYCRSQSAPEFQSSEIHFENLMQRRNFFLDLLYVHEPSTDENKCESIYNNLISLDVNGRAYIFEVGRNATKLHDHMIKLLAHPLQRSIQRDSQYSLEFHLNSLMREKSDL